MEDIKSIIADNIIALRKQNNLTQIDLAEKLNYSDNAVSRWERMEVTPSIETLAQMASIFDVPLASLLQRPDGNSAPVNTEKKAHRLAVTLIYTSFIWLVATVIFVYAIIAFDEVLWQLFVWSVPFTCLVLLPLNTFLGKHIFKFIMFSIFLWTFIASIYFQFFTFNMYMIFLVGVPIQAALAIWTFIKPKQKK